MRILASAILLFLVILLIVVLSAREKDYSRYAVIHMPASGECPKGFQAQPMFKRAGKPYDGCSAPVTAQNGGMLDRLDPGEAINFEYFNPKGAAAK